ncbi:hypothetical protein [Pseudomonas xantholysinigenes]|uniref:Uncharacterized protein n=1 Tax=Pseudomonas xantholysinigenes TaxID=2745490 RepID=A0A9E6TWG6_9PSED|nr:hypothetical protein [Pseudomonas xantholysinigenes]QXI36894.1 hypothetical protein HU772_016240 [Pseudomonas xantholysinigenes]QXI36895.1 hypothetical protein HU772_016245 [Pseudomonas xantholysinigenes]
MEHPAHTLATLKVASTSKPLTFQVKRQAQEHFVAPTVLEAANNGNGPLDPSKATSGATVRVKYDPMQTSDTLVVTWSGVNQADSWKSKSENGSTSGHVDFTVPVSVVAASQGKTIEVAYAVVRNGQPSQSLPLALKVGELPLTELPKPMVPEADQQTYVLDLNSFEGDAKVTVIPWKLMAEKQRYWIKVKGTLENDLTHEFEVASAKSVTSTMVSRGLDELLTRLQLEKLKHDSPLDISVKVTFDGSVNESDAVSFPVNTYTLFKGMSLCEDFSGAPSGMRIPPATNILIPPASFMEIYVMESPPSNVPANARIVAEGSEHRLMWTQHSDGAFGYTILRMRLIQPKSFTRASEITIEFGTITGSADFRIKLSAHNHNSQTPIPSNAKNVTLNLSKESSAMNVMLTFEETYTSNSTHTIQVRSVCWREI